MHIETGVLETTGKTREELAALVSDAVANESRGGWVQLETHNTHHSSDRLSANSTVYETKIDSEDACDVNNLLAEQSTTSHVAEWIRGQMLDAEKCISQFTEPVDEEDLAAIRRIAEGATASIDALADALAQADFEPMDAGGVAQALDQSDFFADLDESEIEDAVRADFYEALSYWITYWEPDGGVDAEIAERCGLIAFEVDDDEFLGLGGCGMDLSPKLHAYCALAYGFLPEDSQFFSQRDYFAYVVGEAVAAEVDEKTRLDTPRLRLLVPLVASGATCQVCGTEFGPDGAWDSETCKPCGWTRAAESDK